MQWLTSGEWGCHPDNGPKLAVRSQIAVKKKIKMQVSKMWDYPIKTDKRKIDEESLKLYGLVKKATEKLMNQISNFEKLEREKSLNMHQ